MHSSIICRPTSGPNLKGKLKFTCVIRTHTFTVQWSDCKRATSSFINLRGTAVTAAAYGGGRQDDARHCR